MNSNDPVPLRDALAEIGREFGLADSNVMSVVSALWRDVAGDAIASHAAPTSVRDGVCVLTVDDPAWATPTRYLEGAIVAAATGRLGPGIVTAIQVRIRRP